MSRWPISTADTRQGMTADVGTATMRGTFRRLSPSIYSGPVRYFTRQRDKEMNGIKGLALGLGVATLIVVGLACGAEEAPAPTGAGPASESSQAEGPSTIEPSTEPPLTSGSMAARENISCFPTGLVARVGASVGDSWTLAGNIRIQGKTPGPPNELRDRSAESSVTFTLTGLDDGGMNRVVDEATGKRARIENSVAYAHAKLSTGTMKAISWRAPTGTKTSITRRWRPVLGRKRSPSTVTIARRC